MTERIALITPARNEADHLPRLIDSVVSQTMLPAVWIIVSDGSTDRTDQIAEDAAARWGFVQSIRRQSSADRDFAKKVRAIEHGLQNITIPFDYIGNLDADIQLPPNYLQQLITEFERDPALGVAGGLVVDIDENGAKISRPGRASIVPGAVQLFREPCWQEIGGYLALSNGSEDTVACLMAQMGGWRTHVISTLEVRHYRAAGTADRSRLMARVREGRRDYATGYHPAFVVAKAVRRITQRPIIFGSLARIVGYVQMAVRGNGPEVSPEVVAFLRDKQLRELRLRRSGHQQPMNQESERSQSESA